MCIRDRLFNTFQKIQLCHLIPRRQQTGLNHYRILNHQLNDHILIGFSRIGEKQGGLPLPKMNGHLCGIGKADRTSPLRLLQLFAVIIFN